MSADNKRILLRRAAGHIVLQEAQSTDFSVKCVNPSALLSLITVPRAGASMLFRALSWGLEGGWEARAGGGGDAGPVDEVRGAGGSELGRQGGWRPRGRETGEEGAEAWWRGLGE